MLYISFLDNLYTGSWDKTLRVWDERSTEAVQKHDLPQKVFSMDVSNNRLVVAMANRQIFVYDIRNMTEPWQTRETSLRYMLKSVRCMPNGEGKLLSSLLFGLNYIYIYKIQSIHEDF